MVSFLPNYRLKAFHTEFTESKSKDTEKISSLFRVLREPTFAPSV